MLVGKDLCVWKLEYTNKYMKNVRIMYRYYSKCFNRVNDIVLRENKSEAAEMIMMREICVKKVEIGLDE